MPENTMTLYIVSAEAELFSGDVAEVAASAQEGEVGIFPGHSQLLSGLKPGDVRVILPDGGEKVFYISGGMLEVQPKTVTILADTAIRAEDIDEAAAIEAKQQAEKAMHDKTADIEYSKAAAALAQAVAQIQAIRKLRRKTRG